MSGEGIEGLGAGDKGLSERAMNAIAIAHL